MVYLFAPGYGEEIYKKTVLIEGWRFYLTSQELFTLQIYCSNIFQRSSCHPISYDYPSEGQFAASLNQIGVPYKFAYSVSLTCVIFQMSKKNSLFVRLKRLVVWICRAGLVKRIRGNLQIVLPLIFHLSNELIPYRQPWSYVDLVAIKNVPGMCINL